MVTNERISKLADRIVSVCPRCDRGEIERLLMEAFTPIEDELHEQWHRAEQAEALLETEQLVHKVIVRQA